VARSGRITLKVTESEKPGTLERMFMPQLVMTAGLWTAAGNGLCGVSIGKKVIVPEYEVTSPATQGSPTCVAARGARRHAQADRQRRTGHDQKTPHPHQLPFQ
jgi:hypothetical protein